MIGVIEQHIAQWLAQRIQELAQESSLFPNVDAAAGSLAVPGHVPADTACILVNGESLHIAESTPQLGGLDPHENDLVADLECSFQVYGPSQADDLNDGAGGVLSDPPHLVTSRTDMAMLAIFHQFRQYLQAAPDIPLADKDNTRHSNGIYDWGDVREGARRMRIRWEQCRIGAITRAPDQDGRSGWKCTLTLAITCYLSPVAANGGRILSIASTVARDDSSGFVQDQSLVQYAPVEYLDLSYFSVSQEVRNELASVGVEYLQDITTTTESAFNTQLDALVTADSAGKDRLRTIRTAARIRQNVLHYTGGGPDVPAVFALPARALLQPTSEENAILAEHAHRPDLQARLASLGLGVAIVLSPESRETVRIGQLLAVPGRSS